MKVLVIGAGGREHALAWKLAASSGVSVVYVAPGNGGTALDARLHNLALTDFDALADFAQAETIALTVVGPEAPLAAGLVDVFRARGLRVFGPTRAAAQLESSKAFAKAFMQRHAIPTAAYATFTDAAAAHAHVEREAARSTAPIVIKADGLAAGKGVVVAASLAQAHQAIAWMLDGADNRLGVQHGVDEEGAQRPRIVIEEFLEGEEASFMVLCDGKNVVPLATSQDHKRLLDGDAGPNTGGMGAYSPAPVVTPDVHARAMREIIGPTIEGLARDGITYTGFLYAGLMIDAHGQPRTVEFNCRLGDPETQPILMRLKSDLFEVLMHATDGTLDQVELEWDARCALGVVMAAGGYPLQPRKGDRIDCLPRAAAGAGRASDERVEDAGSTSDAMIFHAGTALHHGELVTAGGRVLCATALGGSLAQAQQRAYALLQGIRFEGAQYRRDIGHRGMEV